MLNQCASLRRLAAAIHALHGDEHAACAGHIAQQNIRQFFNRVRDVRRTRFLQFHFAAVAVADADGVHTVGFAAVDVKAAVAHHDHVAAKGFNAPADKRSLAGILVVQPRSDDGFQIRRKAEFLCNAFGKNLRLGGHNRNARTVLFQTAQKRRNTRVNLVFRPSEPLKAFVVIVDCLNRLLIRHADDLTERIKQRRPDKYLELLGRIAREAHLLCRVNRRFCNALFRASQRAVQVEKHCCIFHD